MKQDLRDIQQGHLYLDFDYNVDDHSNQGAIYSGLRSQLEELKRHFGHSLFPNFRNIDDIFGYYRRIFFHDAPEQKFFVCNLALENNQKKINLLLRPADILPNIENELPSGLTLALKVSYQVERYNKQTAKRTGNDNPRLTVEKIIGMAHSEKRDFEQEVHARIILSQASYYKSQNKQNNVISPEFVASLPLQSQKTAENLREWNDYLNFWEQYVKQQQQGLRFVKVDLVGSTLRFLTVTESKRDFSRNSRFLRERNTQVRASSLTNSENEWTFKLNENKKNVRESRGTILGDFKHLSGNNNQEIPNEVLSGMPWERPYCTFVAFELNERQKNEYGRIAKKDIEKAQASILKSIPSNGFLVPSITGDIMLIERSRKQLLTQVPQPAVHSP